MRAQPVEAGIATTPAPARIRTTVSVVVPTLNGGAGFAHLCRHLVRLRERRDVEILIIDSGSTDGSDALAERAGLRVHRIRPDEFDHGRTRNLGVELTAGDVVCFLTQDVLPCTPDWPLRFAAALEDPDVAGVYGRQVPRDASTMEMFFVALNYPAQPLRFRPRPGGHHPRPGRVLFSNAFSAVRRDVLQRLPFVERAGVSEDQIWAYRALAEGHTIAYEPRAEALHAHRYSLRGLFRRTYRIGRALRAIGIDGGATVGESMRFLASEVAYFVRHGHVHRLPQLLAYEFVRWAGFQAGRAPGRSAAGSKRPRAGARPGRAGRSGRPPAWLRRLLSTDRDVQEVVQAATGALLLRIVGALLGVALNIYIARVLGPAGAGIFFLALTVTAVAGVLGRLGLEKAVLRFGAVHAARRAWARLAGVERAAVLVATLASTAVAAVMIGAGDWIARDLFDEPRLTLPLRMVALAIVPLGLVALYVELLKGAKRIAAATFGQVVALPLLALPLTAILAPRWSVPGAALAHLAGALGTLAVVVAWWRRAVPELRGVRAEWDLRRLLGTGFPLLWVAAMDLVMTVTDTIMLGAWRTSHEVGVYGVAVRTAMLTSFALVSINSIAAPKFAALHADGERDALARLARKTTVLMTVVTLPLLLAFVIAPGSILAVLYGAGFAEGAAALIVLAAGAFVGVAVGPVGHLLMMCGQEKAMRNAILAAAVLNVGLNAILVPRYGIVGAAFGTAVSTAALNLLAAAVAFRTLSIVTLPLPRRMGADAR